MDIYQFFGGTSCLHRQDRKEINTKFSDQSAPTLELKIACHAGADVPGTSFQHIHDRRAFYAFSQNLAPTYTFLP
jgi:hypothetical protein